MRAQIREASELVERLQALATRLQHADAAKAGGRDDDELSLAMEEMRLAAHEIDVQSEALAEAQELLEEQLLRYRELFHFAPDGYLVTDPNGVILEANRAACAMLEGAPEVILRKPLLVSVESEDHSTFIRLLRDAAAAEGEVVGAQLSLRRRSGGAIPVSAHVVRTNDGGLRFLLRDVSQQKKDERILEELLERERDTAARLRDLDDLKNTVLLAVSHDLSGPVNAMVELADLAISSRGGPERHTERILELIRANALLVQRVQANLLDYDRISRGAVRVHRDEVDLREVVEHVLTTVDSRGRDIAVRVDARTVRIDGALAERILHNLVTNALHHTASDVPVEVEVTVDGDHVRMVVADHGDGVPATMRQGIFEPFTTVERSGGGARGIGVGLYVVNRFAMLHGGRAQVDDRPGGGALFTVELALGAA